MTTTTTASATATEIQRYSNSTTPEATNFFIIACSILGVFMICTGSCCISLHYRKRRMQRIVTAAFEQGLFRHAEVGERVDALRREARVSQVEEVVECPQLYELWQHEQAEWPVTSNPAKHISRPPVHWSEYKPISASVSDPNANDSSRLSELPVDTQLAYLFHAKVQLKREWKRGRQSRGSVPPYKLKYGQKPPSHYPHQSKSPPPGRSHLKLSVLIAMPVPPDSLSAIPAASEDLMLGVASAPCEEIQFGKDDTYNKTETKQTKA